jgi:hypothetical protein
MKPVIVQGRTYRLSGRSDAPAAKEPEQPTRTAPCGNLVQDVAAHQNGCRECLRSAGAYMPPAIRESIADRMWSATTAERMAAFAAWRRQQGDLLLGC